MLKFIRDWWIVLLIGAGGLVAIFSMGCLKKGAIQVDAKPKVTAKAEFSGTKTGSDDIDVAGDIKSFINKKQIETRLVNQQSLILGLFAMNVAQGLGFVWITRRQTKTILKNGKGH